MASSTECPLTTKRVVIGQVIVCSGCCCGAVQRGKPEVPVDWLKQTWRTQGLLKNIQLTISCCLGPCDLPNVVRISSSANDIWLGNVTREHYAVLVDWAVQSKSAGAFVPLPRSLDSFRFDPFRPVACEPTR
jgi:hypothetical protein